MSGWYWRLIAIKAAFVLTCFVSYLRADDTVPKLPFCNPTTPKNSPSFNDLVIVSTLDGKITAFSTESGIKAWVLETQPLLSSNLHHVELSSGGKWVRLVPSLRGNLFSLSGDSIEPLPFDAEQLLSSTFKYSEDLVIAGARETVWLGVDAHTGTVIYECGSSGCNSEQQTAGAGRDIIVLRRHSNTVRALDPRSGNEKWNFSVAEHQLALSRRECAEKNKPQVVAISVALPEGVVVLKNPESKMPLWQQKLDAPVVDMWRFQGGSLEHMDVLLEAAQALIEINSSNSPSLYLGIHNSQFYIQESTDYAQKLETAVTAKPLPWKLKKSRPLLTDGTTALSPVEEDNSLSVVHTQENIEDHGFFIYLQDTCEEITITEDMLPDIVLPNNSNEATHHHVHVHVYSLWFWWKEVLVIAITSALFLNLVIWPRFFGNKIPPATTPLPINQEPFTTRWQVGKPPPAEYSGRYENDFATLKYLGKGGFGVVFEARNKIDHCSYAVKRITLPRRKSARERVLREVRALAKLEHEHIVRYFNAWVEEPPPHWQETRDRQLMEEFGGGMSLAMSEDTSTRPSFPPLEDKSPRKGDVMLNFHKSTDFSVDPMDYGKLSVPRRLRSQSCSDSFTVVFDDDAPKSPHLTSDDLKTSEVTSHTSKHVGSGDNDDSFIVFENSQQNHSGLSEARKDISNRKLEQIKESESYKDDRHIKKKKKGHTRHWSLDMCVKEESKKYLYIQMQLCRRDSLHEWLSSNRTCNARRDLIKPLFDQIVSAVEYVHLAGLIHRDLKPRNIFFAPDGKVKVGDFGLVTSMTDNSKEGPTELDAHALHTHKVGTHLYMSPEQLQGHPYNYKVDIYSLGLVLFELLYPFGTDAERIKCLMNVRHGKYPEDFIKEYTNETEVLKLMLSNNPKQRPTASGVRARAPLYQCTEEQWHFTLPTMVAC